MNKIKETDILDRINSILAGIASTILVLVAVAVTIDVILRYSLNITHPGLFEFTEFSLLWITFLGTAWLLKRGTHINMDLLIGRLNVRQRTIADIVANGTSTILFGILTWYGAKVTLNDFQSHVTLSTVLSPPKWCIEIIIPIGCFLLFLQLILATYRHVVALKSLSGDMTNIK